MFIFQSRPAIFRCFFSKFALKSEYAKVFRLSPIFLITENIPIYNI